jgi:hypothetical protein
MGFPSLVCSFKTCNNMTITFTEFKKYLSQKYTVYLVVLRTQIHICIIHTPLIVLSITDCKTSFNHSYFFW